MNWHRVNRQFRCPICEHPDWCTVSDAGLVLCMRVESPRPSRNAMGGWLHQVGDAPKPARAAKPPPSPPSIRAASLILQWAQETPETALEGLSKSLGVSGDSLAALHAVWARQHRAWAFPMRDGYGETIGVRLRAEDGRKWAVRGSRNGIFLPACDPQSTVYVCEGPTDTAAALTLGLYAIGRPSCSCGGPEIRTACRRLGVRRAVIVADNDEPGIAGARKVASELRLPSCIYIPQAKDLREFVRLGGTGQLIENEVKHTVWTK